MDVKAKIMKMFNDRAARQWRKSCARPEIATDHYPLGWLLPEWRGDVNELSEAGKVRIVELPRRGDRPGTALFLAKGV